MLPATYIKVYVFYMSFVLLQTHREAFVKTASVNKCVTEIPPAFWRRRGLGGDVIYHQAAVTLLSLLNATRTIKGKTTILILLRDIIPKIR